MSARATGKPRAGAPQGPLPDQAARSRAASDFDTNLVIVAGAGTGKTSLLVERILNLVLSGSAELGQSRQ